MSEYKCGGRDGGGCGCGGRGGGRGGLRLVFLPSLLSLDFLLISRSNFKQLTQTTNNKTNETKRNPRCVVVCSERSLCVVVYSKKSLYRLSDLWPYAVKGHCVMLYIVKGHCIA